MSERDMCNCAYLNLKQNEKKNADLLYMGKRN